MRKRLKDNDILNLNCSHCQNEFVIDCTLGEGASSIVYAAHTVDLYGNIKKYRIKECYPVTCEIKREGNNIIWQNESEKENALSRFEDAYNVISNLQCNEALGNNLTHVCEMYTGNGTLYIVMDTNFGQTYDQDTETDLKKILNTILVISKVIKQFHSQGLLYLDLKPENIMVCYEPNVWVWLFDMDSVISLSDLRNEPGRSISYSSGFAAPEQVMGLRNKIGFSTDIYSIGAILFSKIMGRTVTNDDMGFFAEWEFEDEKFSKVNPIVLRLINSIFKKTISASAKRRYQTTDDLIEALEEVITILSKGSPYLKTTGIQQTFFALGRDNEIDEIHEAFSKGKRAVFLHGDGGIGKSTIANLYGNRFKKEYNAVIFCRYDGSLETVEKRLIDNIKNCNIDDNCIEEKRRILSDVLNQKTLIIVDNFDVTIDEDDYLSDFLQYNANMIFTTRTDFSSVFGGDIVQIEVNTLERRAIIELFCNNSDMEVSSLDSIKLLEEIFRCVENNTYAVELLAKQMKASGNSLVELHEKISSGIYSFHNSEKINTVKDGKIIRSNISSIIENLFNVFNLPEMYKQVLMNVHLLGFLDITKDVYRRITNCSSEEMDALNELIELGWIKQGYYGFYLHQLVEDLVKNNLKPDEEKCDTVYDYLKGKIEESIEKIPDYFDERRGSYEAYTFNEICRFICSFFAHTGLNKNSDIKLLLYWMEKLMESECWDIPPISSGTFWDRLYDVMEVAIKEDISSKNAFELGYIVMMTWLDAYRITYGGEDDSVASQKAKREEKALQSFDVICNLVDKIPCEEREKAFKKIWNGVAESVNNTFEKLPVTIVQKAYNLCPESFADVFTDRKLMYEIPLTAEEQKRIEQIFEERAAYEYSEAEKCAKLYEESEDKVKFISDIATDDTISHLERARRIGKCTESILPVLPLMHASSNIKTMKIIEALDLDTIEKVLNIERELLWSIECDPQTADEDDEWERLNSNNQENKIILFAIKEDYVNFNALMSDYFEMEKKDIAFKIEKCNYSWRSFTCGWEFDSNKILRLAKIFSYIFKSSYILKFICAYEDFIKKYAEQDADYDERDMFPLYQLIVLHAENALVEDDIPGEPAAYDYCKKYDEKIAKLTGTFYNYSDEKNK